MIMRHHQYAAEGFGTFCLTLAVCATLVSDHPIVTPVAAAMTLAVLVYTIGPVSGSHVNPAITIALATRRKIGIIDSIGYIVAQCLGAAAALWLCGWMLGSTPNASASDDLTVFAAEVLGAALLAFGVSTAVRNNNYASSGLVVGGGLFIGIILAAGASNAVLNPAVMIGVGSVSPAYLIAPIIGAIAGAWLNAWFYAEA